MGLRKGWGEHSIVKKIERIRREEEERRRSHERENERMDMRVVEEEEDWEYTVCVENVK